MGALEPAGALIDLAGPDTPDLFRRWFDIGILLDRTQAPCAALRQNPALSPTLPARVFCLARGGDWNAAEITLTLGQQVGSIPADEQALLARFLDPELFEDEDPPPVPEPLTPLDFLMREAVGLPRPPGTLPLAFLWTDLDEHVPMRTRIEAAERLTVSGAADYAGALRRLPLRRARRLGRRLGPGAGGAGARRRARRRRARRRSRPALLAADTALTDARPARRARRGLRRPARDARPRVADARGAPRGRRRAPAPRRRRRTRRATRAASPGDAGFAALLAVAGAGAGARRSSPTRWRRPRSPASPPRRPPTTASARLAAMVAEGRQGRAILAALDLVQSGARTDPPALRAGDADAAARRPGRGGARHRAADDPDLAGS